MEESKHAINNKRPSTSINKRIFRSVEFDRSLANGFNSRRDDTFRTTVSTNANTFKDREDFSSRKNTTNTKDHKQERDRESTLFAVFTNNECNRTSMTFDSSDRHVKNLGFSPFLRPNSNTTN